MLFEQCPAGLCRADDAVGEMAFGGVAGEVGDDAVPSRLACRLMQAMIGDDLGIALRERHKEQHARV
jgi:hypothetical protein